MSSKKSTSKSTDSKNIDFGTPTSSTASSHVDGANITTRPPPSNNRPPPPSSQPMVTSLLNVDRKTPSSSVTKPTTAWRPPPPSGPRRPPTTSIEQGIQSESKTPLMARLAVPSSNRVPASTPTSRPASPREPPTASLAHIDGVNPHSPSTKPNPPPISHQSAQRPLTSTAATTTPRKDGATIPLVNDNKNPSSMKPCSPSFAPPKTLYTNPHDIKMAGLQTQYHTLLPAAKEQQEKWAQKKLEDMPPCPSGWGWDRVKKGYMCTGGHHFVSDALLAEGRGGVMETCNRFVSRTGWRGPFYDGVLEGKKKGKTDKH